MKVASVERILVHLPLTERQDRILPPGSFRDIRVLHLCKATLTSGEVGWGEESQRRTTDAQLAMVLGEAVPAVMNNDAIGAPSPCPRRPGLGPLTCVHRDRPADVAV